MIHVVHVNDPILRGLDREIAVSVYIGPQMPGYRASRLAMEDQFLIFREADRITKRAEYRVWLYEQLQNPESPACVEINRIRKYAIDGDLYLTCWCKHIQAKSNMPERPCHGDIVKAGIEWLNAGSPSKHDASVTTINLIC